VTILFAVLGGVALFSGILVLQGTLAFWTVESLEIVNALTYGGVEAGQYPMDIYARWFRNFLTFIVPLASVSYFPVSAVLGRGEVGAIWWRLTPAFGFGFFALSLLVWQFGVRRYTSTGS
jgi:ABC-2 type transport system permease protein